ncbi:MAG: hypothetical protein AAF585_25420, partial [Verrucomicrobiota bacterium]
MRCPDEIHEPLSEILYWTLLEVRLFASDRGYCFALADHAHNIPHLMSDFAPENLFYYWEVEKDCYLRAL